MTGDKDRHKEGLIKNKAETKFGQNCCFNSECNPFEKQTSFYRDKVIKNVFAYSTAVITNLHPLLDTGFFYLENVATKKPTAEFREWEKSQG